MGSLRETLRRLFGRGPETETRSASQDASLHEELTPEIPVATAPVHAPKPPSRRGDAHSVGAGSSTRSAPTAKPRKAEGRIAAGRASAQPTAAATTPPSPKPDATSLLRHFPRFQHVRSRTEDPEAVANDGYRLLDQLRDKVGGMLLLSATPMQLHDFELYSMIELVEPGLFNGYGDFADSRQEIAAINGAVGVLRSDRPTLSAINGCLDLLRSYDAGVDLLEVASGGRSDREIAATWLSRCHRLSLALVRNRKTEIGGFTQRKA